MIERLLLIVFTFLCAGNLTICILGLLTFSEFRIRIACGALAFAGILLGSGLHYLYFVKDIFSMAGMILGCFFSLFTSMNQVVQLTKWKNTHLSTSAIRDLVNHLNVGLCYSMARSGKIVLCNNLMQAIGEKLLGHKPINGRELLRFNQQTISFKDGIYQFTAREILVRNHHLIEICAYDLSKQKELNIRLQDENRKLEKMNEKLRKYLGLIEEITREGEILKTKENIHSNFGRLLLSTVRNIEQEGSTEEMNRILKDWKNLLTLMELDTDKEEHDPLREVMETAQSVDVQIHVDGKPPEKGTIDYEIFVSALSECLTNTVEHADGHHMFVNISYGKEENFVLIGNDGKSPDPGSKEGGGLRNLRQKVESTGGLLEISYEPAFIMRISKLHKRQS